MGQVFRELSNGHFTDDNHKQLTGVDLDVPVYEAKMTRDTRLIVSPASSIIKWFRSSAVRSTTSMLLLTSRRRYVS